MSTAGGLPHPVRRHPSPGSLADPRTGRRYRCPRLRRPGRSALPGTQACGARGHECGQGPSTQRFEAGRDPDAPHKTACAGCLRPPDTATGDARARRPAHGPCGGPVGGDGQAPFPATPIATDPVLLRPEPRTHSPPPTDAPPPTPPGTRVHRPSPRRGPGARRHTLHGTARGRRAAPATPRPGHPGNRERPAPCPREGSDLPIRPPRPGLGPACPAGRRQQASLLSLDRAHTGSSGTRSAPGPSPRRRLARPVACPAKQRLPRPGSGRDEGRGTMAVRARPPGRRPDRCRGHRAGDLSTGRSQLRAPRMRSST